MWYRDFKFLCSDITEKMIENNNSTKSKLKLQILSFVTEAAPLHVVLSSP